MKSFAEAVQSFGWTTDADGNHCAVVGRVDVCLERLLYGQWYLK